MRVIVVASAVLLATGSAAVAQQAAEETNGDASQAPAAKSSGASTQAPARNKNGKSPEAEAGKGGATSQTSSNKKNAGSSEAARGGGEAEAAAPAKKPFIDAPYVSGTLGWHAPLNAGIDNFNTSVRRQDGFDIHGAIGHQYRQWRAEAELGWFRGQAGINNGESDTVSAMVNAYYDFDTGTAFTPFIGGGMGLGWINFSDVGVPGFGRINDNEVGLAWQVKTGLAYKLTDTLSLFGDYRWFDIANVKMKTPGDQQIKLGDFGSHNLELGIRYRF